MINILISSLAQHFKTAKSLHKTWINVLNRINSYVDNIWEKTFTNGSFTSKYENKKISWVFEKTIPFFHFVLTLPFSYFLFTFFHFKKWDVENVSWKKNFVPAWDFSLRSPLLSHSFLKKDLRVHMLPIKNWTKHRTLLSKIIYLGSHKNRMAKTLSELASYSQLITKSNIKKWAALAH